jgi:hypothetical protein
MLKTADLPEGFLKDYVIMASTDAHCGAVDWSEEKSPI